MTDEEDRKDWYFGEMVSTIGTEVGLQGTVEVPVHPEGIPPAELNNGFFSLRLNLYGDDDKSFMLQVTAVDETVAKHVWVQMEPMCKALTSILSETLRGLGERNGRSEQEA